jgi:hypothetical protein
MHSTNELMIKLISNQYSWTEMGRNELCFKVCLDGGELEEMKPLYD